MRKFESFYIGESASLTHEVRKSDVEKFVELSGDDNKLHVDSDFANKTSFNKPVVHGMIGVSFISTLIGTKIPGDGALWYKQSIEFLLPVRIGDVIDVYLEIIGINTKNKSLELKTEIRNQHKQVVTFGISEVKVIEIDEQKALANIEIKSKKVALIIGGSGGIGAEVCLNLSNKGYDIAIHYFSNREAAINIKNEIEANNGKAIVYQCDINNLDKLNELKTYINRNLGLVTHVINCATPSTPNIKFDVIDWGKFDEHLSLNIKGSFNVVKIFLPDMLSVKTGNFIFLTSQFVDTPKTELTYYITAKSALQGFVKSLAMEYGPKKIRFNLVSPGMTKTNLLSDVPEKTKLLYAMNTPLRRLANVEDVANAVTFLASDESSYITGEILRVNGGQIML